jgi:hypothetical protein
MPSILAVIAAIALFSIALAQAPERTGFVSSDPDRPWIELRTPPSDLIAGISFNASTRRTEARGSDIWPITWVSDSHQYSAFGDGAGFGVASGKEANGRDPVSLGVARIKGAATNYVGRNVRGGKQAENAAQFSGKGTGLISVDGALFMWVAGPDSLTVPETRLAVSRDLSKTWSLVDWKWTMQDRLFAGVFVNHGQDNAGAKDEFVCACFTRLAAIPAKPRNWAHEVPGQVDLARVHRSKITGREAWDWFEGLDETGRPKWTKDLQLRKPTFEDPNGIKVVSVSHNRGLDRYLLLYNPHDNRGHFACMEATAPWGPWRQVAYLKSQALFMPPQANQRVSVFHFGPKWWSDDGREFTLVFNTGDDAWNTVRGTLTTR